MAIIDAQLLTFSVSDGEVVPAPILIGQLVNVSGNDGEAADIDVSHFGSTAKEFLIGLAVEGGFKLKMRLDPTDAGQKELLEINSSRTTREMVLTFITGHIFTFDAYVKNVSETGAIDGVMDRDVDMMITGDVVATGP